jgi:hypothetical protein
MAVLLALALTDLSAVSRIEWRVEWRLLPLVGFVVLAIIGAFAWRWRTLLREELAPGRTLLVTALGLGANQVLPLRGGDALRVALSSRGPRSPSLHATISALALEKVFDLIAVAGFGAASAFVFLGKASAGLGMRAVFVAGAILIATACLLALARNGGLSRVVRRVARTVRLTPRVYRHVYAPLHHFRLSADPARLLLLLLETAVIWLVLYTVGYLLIARMIGIPLAFEEVLVLLFAAAVGLAVPAAPSGIGTFHAAIVSAFAVLGRSTADGLVLAVAIHLVFFIALSAIGAMVLPWLALRSQTDLQHQGRKKS